MLLGTTIRASFLPLKGAASKAQVPQGFLEARVLGKDESGRRGGPGKAVDGTLTRVSTLTGPKCTAGRLVIDSCILTIVDAPTVAFAFPPNHTLISCICTVSAQVCCGLRAPIYS